MSDGRLSSFSGPRAASGPSTSSSKRSGNRKRRTPGATAAPSLPYSFPFFRYQRDAAADARAYEARIVTRFPSLFLLLCRSSSKAALKMITVMYAKELR